MKKLVILLVIVAMAAAAYFFGPWKDGDSDSDADSDSGEPVKVALHSADKKLTVEDPKVTDLRFHFWRMTGQTYKTPYSASTEFQDDGGQILMLSDTRRYFF